MRWLRTPCICALLIAGFAILRFYVFPTPEEMPLVPVPPRFDPPTKPMTPLNGSVMLAGGGNMPDSVYDAFLKLAGGAKAELVYVPTGWDWGKEGQAERAIEAWHKRGFARVAILHTHFHSEANDPAFVKPLTTATAVWFRGGDQTRLLEIYKGTLVEKELHRLVDRGGVAAGSSAGAMIMSRVTITRANDAMPVRAGFGILPHVIVDSHFLKRNRIDRLHDVLGNQVGFLGLGVDEGTAAIVTGTTLTVVGSSTVIVCQLGVPEYRARSNVLNPGDTTDLAELTREALGRGAKSTRDRP
jgi:cyanophycinase